MIRNPIHATAGRGRPDLARVSSGIAASLRHFSIAQARCSDEQTQRPSAKQRVAAAASELLSMNDPRQPQQPRPLANMGGAQPPKAPPIISVASLRGGLRGGIQGRSDDRPGRRGRPSRQEEDEDRNRYKAYQAMEGEDPQLSAYYERIDCGVAESYQPSVNLLDDLAGYLPAVATSCTPLAHKGVVMGEARVLGGGHAFEATHWVHPTIAKDMYKDGYGAFFPTMEAKEQAKEVLKMDFKAPDETTRKAILEKALLGKYEGPTFAEKNNPVGVLRSYVRRDGTWNARAEKNIEEKVRSLLPARLLPPEEAAAAAARNSAQAKARTKSA
ncbi:uncharacterized protein BCR38DRAFT_124172 [Pseudomassariella vexata]|uniref:Uncharacterized protein n=1 Tax=Pseudomassariella vexata TaxID=1141098 RepID=A0A1Y2D8E6_9PEZI|nr:uncharacterized protein BCR38DRAFT_124172 [Pseudomassariella vexata]ORY55444.1 hypothetical protein BCR38DRAFT_124172 [Pseudomassariella vexata]